MIRRMSFVVSLLACLVATAAAFGKPQAPPRDSSHDAWVAATVKQMASVKVGMTEADLLAVFKPENPNWQIRVGGVATTYASRASPYFKVDVVFSEMSPFNLIAKISRPYVEPPGMFD
jgi:hypothetical protein